MNFSTKNILDIPIANVTLPKIVPLISSLIESPGKKTLFGVNAYNLNFSSTDKEYKTILQNATFIYPEGYGVILASKILGKSLLEKTTLMDFIYGLLEVAEKQSWSIYLLGGREEVVGKAAKNLRLKYPSLVITGYHHGYFTKEEEQQLLKQINIRKPTILFVAMGTPQQEKWVAENIKTLSVKAFFGIGGSIDIISNVRPRAPFWMHAGGLEWLFRLFLEPRRLWKRYLVGNVLFLASVFKERIRIRSKKDL